jgi:alpha-beta hydrolase superfamily lysophospholipase
LDADVESRHAATVTPIRQGRGDHDDLFFSASDGVPLHYARWSTDAPPPWAVLVFLHGIASHAGWFGETAADLRRRGIVVYAPDRRGSGISGGWPGHLESYERALADVDEVMALVASEQSTLPVFLAASSWAAKLALPYVERSGRVLAGLLLLGPGLRPRVGLSGACRIEVAVRHFVTPTAALPIPLTPEMYTANPAYLAFIRDDPLRLQRLTAQFYWETARLDRRRNRASRRLRLPLLVLQGEADAMMDVPATRRWFSRLALVDKTYRSYPGAGHTLDFEPNRFPYVEEMVGWLRRRATVSDRAWSGVGCPS